MSFPIAGPLEPSLYL